MRKMSVGAIREGIAPVPSFELIAVNETIVRRDSTLVPVLPIVEIEQGVPFT